MVDVLNDNGVLKSLSALSVIKTESGPAYVVPMHLMEKTIHLIEALQINEKHLHDQILRVRQEQE